MLPVVDSPACSTTYTTHPSSDFDTIALSLTSMPTPIATGLLALSHGDLSPVTLYFSREHQWHHGYRADSRSLPPPPWKQKQYIALYYVVQEIVWFRALLIGLELIDSGTPTTILIDNTSARSLAYNPVHHSRSKHIDVKFHWFREQVAAGHTTLEYVESAKQLADLLAHILTGDNFYRHSVWIMYDPSSPALLRYVLPDGGR
jgi:hypothetical protein